MITTHLIAVGACAIDTILTVPYFPEEDSKLRALSLTKRRGGNCPNSLEVLCQLVDKFTSYGSQKSQVSNDIVDDRVASNLKLSLIATLPSRSSPEIPFITSSFSIQKEPTTSNVTKLESENVLVDLSRCVYREAFTEPISSYIICSEATSSRTIVNHNELPELTLDEFIDATADIVESRTSNDDNASVKYEQFWFHFEGRIPETTLKCIRYLRNQFTSKAAESGPKLRISVELEKPKREGLQELAYDADVIFYSKSWAEAEGHGSAEICLKEQAKLLANKGTELDREQTLVCTWGDHGACALQLPSHGGTTSKNHDHASHKVLYSSAYINRDKQVLDTVGAGDTFIAGMLFGFICRSYDGKTSDDSTRALDVKASHKESIWSLEQRLAFANELAGRKVLQQGFQGLAGKMEGLVQQLDSTSGQ